MIYDTVIRGGTLVAPGGTLQTDLAITGETIAAIGHGLAGRQVIDATGKLVIPGAIDPHVHLEMQAGAVRSSDDWVTGTVAAACGGTTTVIDFAEPVARARHSQRPASEMEPVASNGMPETGDGLAGNASPLRDALAARRGLAEGRAAVDFGLHMTLLDASPETLAEIPAVIAAGCPSFKTYTTYAFKLTDDVLVAAMEAVGKAGGIVMVHAENDAGIAFLRRKLLDEGHVEPRYHPISRPASMEVEAIERALALAEAAECPAYIAHISTGRGAAAVAGARSRGQAAFGETCPQYLLLTDAEFDRPGFESARFVCSPPLRKAEDNAALWKHLAGSDLQTVGTDHCPFFFAGQKNLGQPQGDYPPFTRIPGGMPGIESRLALLYTFGVGTGRLSLERWVEVCCSGPAEVFGLHGRKGVLAVGADADIVIFDPRREIVLTHGVGATPLRGADDGQSPLHVHRLHERCDYTPYEGFRLRGWPSLTMLRGYVIARDGEFIGQPGCGRFLSRQVVRKPAACDTLHAAACDTLGGDMAFIERNAKGLVRCLAEANLDPEKLRMHISEIAPGTRAHPPHTHNAIEAFYVLEGCGTVEVGAERHTLGANEVLILDAAVPHGLENTGDTTMRYLVIIAKK